MYLVAFKGKIEYFPVGWLWSSASIQVVVNGASGEVSIIPLPLKISVHEFFDT
jgi:hypothetical protein